MRPHGETTIMKPDTKKHTFMKTTSRTTHNDLSKGNTRSMDCFSSVTSVKSAVSLFGRCCLLMAALTLFVPRTHAQIILAESHFDNPVVGADGWRGTNNLNGSESLQYLAGGSTSNSVGYISVHETAGDSAIMYLVAPPKFLGDKRAAYNGVLSLRFKQSATSSFTGANRYVLLFSTNFLLSFDLTLVPGTAWETYEIPLNENVGWHVASSASPFGPANQLATQADLLGVLRSLNMIWIRAEYSSQNYDRSDLDDVLLLGQPSGALRPTLSLAAYGGTAISGVVGQSYRVEYQDAPAAAWQKLSDVVLPWSPYLFIDQSSRSASPRVYRAVAN